jgi:hypothetical protein
MIGRSSNVRIVIFSFLNSESKTRTSIMRAIKQAANREVVKMS